jgi:hypothetical protein
MNTSVRLLAVPTVALAVGAALWFLIGVPSWRDLPEIRRDLAERRGQLEAWTTPKSSHAEEDQQRGQHVGAATATLEQAGAPAGQALSVIVTLEQIAASRNVIQRIQLGDPTIVGNNGWQQSVVNLEVIGTFDAVANYLADLYRLPWVLNLTQLNIQREQPGKVNATMVGTMLWRQR